MKRIKIQVSTIVLCLLVTLFEASASNNETYSDIREAVQLAYSLEKTMHEKISTFKTKQELVNHFRAGFSAKLSKRLATHFWDMENKKVNTNSKPILVKPETVHILGVKTLRATVYFDSPSLLIRHWKHKKFAQIRLGLVNKHWIVYQMGTTDLIQGK